MQHTITINRFTLEFHAGGHPITVNIRAGGETIARMDHRELVDLEYAISRIREQVRQCLSEPDKHEADGTR